MEYVDDDLELLLCLGDAPVKKRHVARAHRCDFRNFHAASRNYACGVV